MNEGFIAKCFDNLTSDWLGLANSPTETGAAKLGRGTDFRS